MTFVANIIGAIEPERALALHIKRYIYVQMHHHKKIHQYSSKQDITIIIIKLNHNNIMFSVTCNNIIIGNNN